MLDPRVAYLMTNMMEEVLRSGTAAGVRARYNLNLPAAGQDRHFARRLVRRATRPNCCAWSGWASTTIASWTSKARIRPLPSGREFMKRATQYREYRDTKPFQAPDGIVSIEDRSAVGNARHARLVRPPARRCTSPARSRWRSARCTAAAARSPTWPAGDGWPKPAQRPGGGGHGSPRHRLRRRRPGAAGRSGAPRGPPGPPAGQAASGPPQPAARPPNEEGRRKRDSSGV